MTTLKKSRARATGGADRGKPNRRAAADRRQSSLLLVSWKSCQAVTRSHRGSGSQQGGKSYTWYRVRRTTPDAFFRDIRPILFETDMCYEKKAIRFPLRKNIYS